ncbi:MAG TPA: hypothetical protein VHE78_04845, partial [Gemmatimonadaceae bacterium]|nr:hypothetical protein [Gemmatimonadaceae bacterium]
MAADTKDPPPAPTGEGNAVATAAMVIIIVMTVAALRLGRSVVLPVVLSVLLSLLLGTPMRWLHRHHVPERIGAALVVFGALALAAGAAALLIAPATDWINTAPATLKRVEGKVRRL